MEDLGNEPRHDKGKRTRTKRENGHGQLFGEITVLWAKLPFSFSHVAICHHFRFEDLAPGDKTVELPSGKIFFAIS